MTVFLPRPAEARAQAPVRARRRLEALRSFGFRPAFWDHARARLHPSLDSHGLPAEDHRPEGLPDEAVVLRTAAGRVLALRPTIVAGYERDGYFYTRAHAIRATRRWAVRSTVP